MLKSWLLIFALLFALNPTSLGAAEPVKVLLKWYHQFQFAGFYAAVKQGYYRDFGLEVQLVEGGQEISSDPVPLVLAGEYDFSVASLSLFDNFYRNRPVVVLSQIFQQNPYVFVSNNAKGVYDFKAFLGKTLVINRGAGEIIYTFLSKMGVNKSDIKIIDVIDPVHAMSSGLIDVYFTYSSSFPYALSGSGVVPFELRPEEYGWNFIGDSLITRKELVDKRPDLVRNFVQATLKGWEYALDHQDELINYILGLKSKKPYSVNYEMMKYEAKKIERYVARDLVEVGHIHLQRWENLYRRYCEDDNRRCTNYDLAPFFYIDSRDYQKYFNVSTLGIIILLSIICIFIFFIVQLRYLVRKRTQQMMSEIAQRKKTEQELKLNDYAVSLALEGGGIGFFDLKFPFHKMQTNEQFAIQMGFSPENFHETLEHWMKSMHPEDLEVFINLWEQVKLGKLSSFDCELRVAHALGHWKWLLCRGRVVEWDGERIPRRILGVLLDIHDLKSMAEKASSLGQQQCALFSSMGHEIRTPLNSIMGFAELLVDEDNAEKRYKYIRQISSSSGGLLRVISGLIEIAGAEFEGKEIKQNSFIPKIVLQKIFAHLVSSEQWKDCKIEYSPIHPLPDHVKASESVLSNILFLFGEYFQRMQLVGKTKVLIEYIAQNDSVGHLKISYSFFGSNFSSDEFIRLLSAQWTGWQQWDKSSNRDFALMVAKRLMDLTGASFSMSATASGESLYSLIFPVSLQVAPSEQTDHDSLSLTVLAKHLSARNLLVVDDDQASSLLVKTVVEKYGGIVTVAKDGLSAIRMAQKTPFDLIIMDIQMIGLDGIETAKIMRSKGINTPLIALSAHAPELFNKKLSEAGFVDFLHKPVSGRDLLDSIYKNCPK